MDTTNLKRKRHVWFVRLVVPEKLRAKVGRRELLRTLETRDIREASRRKYSVLAQLHRELDAIAKAPERPGMDSPGYALDVAKGQLQAIQDGLVDAEVAEAGLDVAMENQLDHLRRKHGYDEETGEPRNSAVHLKTHRLAERLFGGEPVAMLSEAIRQYLDESSKVLRKQTTREKERHFEDLQAWLKTDVEVCEVTKQIAGRYIAEFLLTKNHSAKTTRDTISNLSTFWTWMERRGLTEGNPWRGMSATVKSSTRGTAPKRRPWTDAELLRLVKAMDTTDPLLPFTVIAAYTGMRREEVASLRVADVETGALNVRGGKSRAAVRAVPIHPALKPLVEQLITTAKDGFLIPGLLTGGADAKRAHYIGKRFGHVIRGLGFDDPALVFHTLRNAFIQRCEEGGVPESSAKLLVGHSRRESLTYGDAGAGYSPGVRLETLRKEIAKVTFGKLDDYIKQIACRVKITQRSRRRPKRET